MQIAHELCQNNLLASLLVEGRMRLDYDLELVQMLLGQSLYDPPQAAMGTKQKSTHSQSSPESNRWKVCAHKKIAFSEPDIRQRQQGAHSCLMRFRSGMAAIVITTD
jgi:hypothetical protein